MSHVATAVWLARRLISVATTEADPVFAGLFRLDSRVQRQQVGLVGDPVDGGHDRIDVSRLFVQHRQLGTDRVGGFDHLVDGLLHADQRGAPGIGARRRSPGNFSNVVHGADQFLPVAAPNNGRRHRSARRR
jgi:hypothetical protein